MTGVGLMEVTLGTGAVIVKAVARVPVPALGLVTETVRAPGVALAGMVMLAVSWVLDTNVAPRYGALVGEVDERAGQGLAAVIVKNRALEVPPPGAGVKTATLAVRGIMEKLSGLLARSAARMVAVS